MKRIILAVTNDLIADQRIHRIALTLLTLGTEVWVVGRRFRKGSDPGLRPYKTKRFRLLFNKGPLFYAEYNIRLFFFLLRMRKNLIVSNDLDTLPAGFLASKFSRATLVYDSHELFTEVPELTGRKFARSIWESVEAFILPKIKHSYTVCNSIAEYYNNKYGINMKVIRNVPLRKQAGKYQAGNLRISNEKIIIYQGALNLGRGLELLIQSMQYMSDTRLIIIGTGDVEKKLIGKVKELNLTDKVTFTGRIPQEQLYNYTLQADLGVSLEENMGLNYYFALPNKLFDYIQAEVPVVVSDFPEMAQIVNKYDVGMTTGEKDPEKLGKLISKLLNDKSKMDKWKKNLKQAAEELCWEKEQSLVKKLYEKII